MNNFSFSTSKNIICELGASANLGSVCSNLGCHKALLITDPGIASLGLHSEALSGLKHSNIGAVTFSEVEADPSEAKVLTALSIAKDSGVDVIIGFGGGSSMDVAKIVSLLAHPSCIQNIQEIYGVNMAKGKRLPLIQIPTTAGTGSEVTPIAIVTTGQTSKTGIVTPLFLPDITILDAKLTVGLPSDITAATGIDAMVHAIEAFTSKIKKNPMSDLMAKEALRLLSGSIEKAVHEGIDLVARENMLLGAMYAGQAFANSPVAAVHALAYPLGGHFHIPHGLSNSLVLPHVMRFNAPEAAPLYAELAPIILQKPNILGNAVEITQALITGIETLIKGLGLPMSLKAMAIDNRFLPTLAKDAMLQQRLLVNNPRELQYEDALRIYQAAF